jgi:hypothetical protein
MLEEELAFVRGPEIFEGDRQLILRGNARRI